MHNYMENMENNYYLTVMILIVSMVMILKNWEYYNYSYFP